MNFGYGMEKVLFQEYRPIESIHSPVFLVAGGNIKEFVVIVRLQEVDGLLKLIKILSQHLSILEAVDEFGEILHILGESRNAMWVNVLHISRKRKGLD